MAEQPAEQQTRQPAEQQAEMTPAEIEYQIMGHEMAIAGLEAKQRRHEEALTRHFVCCELYASEVQRLELLLSHVDEVAASVYRSLLIAVRKYYQAEQAEREATRQAHGRVMDELRKHYLPLEWAKQARAAAERRQEAQR